VVSGALGDLSHNLTNGGLNGRQKLIAQPGTLPLVSNKGFLDIRRSLRTNDD
jgi:hypothetical protein